MSRSRRLLIFVVLCSLPTFAQLTHTTKTFTSGTGCVQTTTDYYWTYKDSKGVSHSFPGYTQVETLYGAGCHFFHQTTVDELSSDGQYYPQATGAGGSVGGAGKLLPKYQVVS